MNAFRRRLKTFTGLALVAMCGLAFGPSISRALATTSGMASMAKRADCPEHSHLAMGAPGHAGHPGGPSHSTDSLDCCGLCTVAASPFAATAFFAAALASAQISSAPLQLGDSSALSAQRELWPTAAPRGPPRRA